MSTKQPTASEKQNDPLYFVGESYTGIIGDSSKTADEFAKKIRGLNNLMIDNYKLSTHIIGYKCRLRKWYELKRWTEGKYEKLKPVIV